MTDDRFAIETDTEKDDNWLYWLYGVQERAYWRDRVQVLNPLDWRSWEYREKRRTNAYRMFSPRCITPAMAGMLTSGTFRC